MNSKVLFLAIFTGILFQAPSHACDKVNKGKRLKEKGKEARKERIKRRLKHLEKKLASLEQIENK